MSRPHGRARAQVGQRPRVAWPAGGTRAASSASSGTTHGEIDVANDLPRNGPSGTYSQACRSRADQSLTRHDAEDVLGEGVDRDRCAERRSDTDDEAQLGLDVEPGARAEGRRGRRRALRWPQGRTTSVPETTTVPARPW